MRRRQTHRVSVISRKVQEANTSIPRSNWIFNHSAGSGSTLVFLSYEMPWTNTRKRHPEGCTFSKLIQDYQDLLSIYKSEPRTLCFSPACISYLVYYVLIQMISSKVRAGT
ncbi:hypothetical protein ILYODFUR_037208 [Ilyodon furcidens]|uniref:Uncharacterized protein n=1 Tax=Ilyodon furcidens TaxID=33524 RepID=A0ABV0TFF4_9TELE